MTASAPPVPQPPAPPAPAPPWRRRFGYRPELDGLRGVAVATVVVYHFGKLLWPEGEPWLAPGGQSGLDLFFVLSGFLIATLLLAEHDRSGRIDLAHFWWRRVLRLLPALAAMMAALLAASFVGEMHEPGRLLSSAGWVLTFSTNLVIDRPILEVSHTWSLSVEAHFYLVWGLTAALVTLRARRPHRALAAIAVAGIVAVAVARAVAHARGGNLYDIYLSSAYRFDAPLIGALAGVALAAGWLDAVPRRVAAVAGGTALGLFAVAAYRARSFDPTMFNGGYTAVALCAAVAVVGPQLAGPGILRRALSARPLVGLGKISYSVYLWHMPLFMWLDRNAGPWPIAVKALVSGTAVLSVATLSYLLIERPVLRRGSRPVPGSAPAPAPAPDPAPAPASAPAS